ALPVPFANRLVEERRILRRIDLDVLAPEAPELFDFPSCEVDEISEIAVSSWVGGPGFVGVVVRGGLLRADERHFDRPGGPSTQVRELLDAHLTAPAKLADSARTAQRELLTPLVAEGDGPPAELVESLERVDQVAEEG